MENLLNKRDKNHKCIWMSAGIISYKLCNCQFQCETCAFDKVMLLQNKIDVTDETSLSETIQTETDNATISLINQYLYSFLSDFKIHLDRFYHPSHFWYKLESDNMVGVGINKLFLKILEPFQEFKLPEVGEEYDKGQPISWIIRDGMNIPLNSAVNGKIIEINEISLMNGVEELPGKDTFYFMMEVKNIREEIEQFCTTICGLKYFIDTVSLLKKYLHKTFRWYQATNLGITLTDGGRIQVCLEKVLGEEEYRQLLDELI